MYEQGQVWLWGTRIVFIDKVIRYKTNEEERINGKVRELTERNELNLQTITINFNKEKDDMTFIGEMEDNDYIQFVTAAWHKKVPETLNYEVCSMTEATHVIFTEMDLKLAGEDGGGFTPLKIYSVKREESGDLYIINDKDDIIVAFDLFIPCEYMRKTTKESNKQNHRVLTTETFDNVVSISDYVKRKKNR